MPHDSAIVTHYLLVQQNASVSTLSPIIVAKLPSTELFSILLSHGWDINQRGTQHGPGGGNHLIDCVYNSAELVGWCLNHDASGDEEQYEDWYVCPPLLETVVAMGALSTFKLLHEKGAKTGRRTLHKAVSASMGSDIEKVRDLVDEVGIDTNEKLPDHWEPPIYFASNR